LSRFGAEVAAAAAHRQGRFVNRLKGARSLVLLLKRAADETSVPCAVGFDGPGMSVFIRILRPPSPVIANHLRPACFGVRTDHCDTNFFFCVIA
jgi:hypothetical protein